MTTASSSCSKIVSLPADVAVQISSSTAIPSLTSVVIGLLENSLDAGATEVEIGVDFRRASCTVEDDGDGIAPEEFTEEGGLGKRFYTSKYRRTDEPYGGHGTFLSSVAALSILSVTSRQCKRISQSTLILHHSRPAARLLTSRAHDPLLIHDHGTRVIVRDLFGNMPVRVKQRNAAPLECARYETKAFEQLSTSITSVLLAFHRPVHILLQQAEEGTLTKKMHIGAKPEPSSATHDDGFEPSIKISLICKILTHTGYIDPSEWGDWVKTSARTFNITIRGAISLQPAPSKRVQFISLGKRPLNQEKDHNILYEEMNRLFALSSFGHQEDISNREDVKRIKDRRYKSNGFTNRQLKGRGKGVDRWPMFYIRVDLGELNDTKKLEQEATLSRVLKVLRAMVHGFLKTNHFRPQPFNKGTRPSPTSSSKTSSLKGGPAPGDAFSSWSRIKSSNRAEASTLTHPKANVHDPPHAFTSPIVNVRTIDATQEENTRLVTGAGEELIEWTNPISKAAVFINSRTGLVVTRPTPANRPATAPAELQRPNAASRVMRTTSRRFTTPQPGSWAENLLTKWENPVFAPSTEEPITQAFFNNLHFDAVPTSCDHTSDADITKAFDGLASTLRTRLSKATLQSAQVIAQVDKKFILISVSTPETQNLLVLIDQHAADERVRLESLLHDLQTQAPVPVIKPVIFDIAAREHSLFTAQAPFFAHWGITYTLSPPNPTPGTTTTTTSTSRLVILTLPPTIASRCQTDPHILLSFLRTEVWSLDSFFSAVPSSSTPPPQGIVDMLSSRACRSAIMFNDVLSQEEARTLVQKVANTQRPWVCAHGRPSMIPIVEVEAAAGACDGGGASHGHGEGEMGFGLLRRGWRGGGSEGLKEVDAGSEEVSSFQGAWRQWKGQAAGRGREEAVGPSGPVNVAAQHNPTRKRSWMTRQWRERERQRDRETERKRAEAAIEKWET